MTTIRNFEALFIFCCGLIIFTIGLGQQEAIGFESRFYLFAVEMWRHGLSFFPTTYQHPYPDYPASSTVLIYGFAKLMGGLTKFVAVFPSAVAAAITLTFTYMIGALRERRWGICAVCLLLFTNQFLVEARTISLDQYTTAVTTICFYIVYSAEVLKKNWRFSWLPLLLILGFLFRGPIGLIVPAGVLFVYFLLDRKLKWLIALSLLSALILTVCSVLMLGAAYNAGGFSFVQEVLHMEVLGRMHDVATPPVYFYFVESLGAYAVTYPLAILTLVGLTKEIFKRNSSLDLNLIKKLLGWALVVLVGLSVPADKKIRYILAASPALALISAYLFVAPTEYYYLAVLRRVVYRFCYYLPSLLIAATIAICWRHHQLLTITAYQYAILGFALLQLGVIASRHLLQRKQVSREVPVLIAAALAFVIANLTIIEPINLYFNRTRDFVKNIEKIREQQHAQLVFYHVGSDGIAIKYVANMPREDRPQFINTAPELAQYKKRAFFITDQESYSAIPKDVLQLTQEVKRGKIGHDTFVIFTQRDDQT